MCGIVGYIGNREASEVLIEALKRLEYRGYDSSGVAVIDPRNDKAPLMVQKSQGYISELEKKLEMTGSQIGISHTRWATHGVPNEINAHFGASGSPGFGSPSIPVFTASRWTM